MRGGRRLKFQRALSISSLKYDNMPDTDGTDAPAPTRIFTPHIPVFLTSFRIRYLVSYPLPSDQIEQFARMPLRSRKIWTRSCCKPRGRRTSRPLRRCCVHC